MRTKKRSIMVMSMIEYINKDITTVTRGVVAHSCNAQMKMASGVAKAIRDKWPGAYRAYTYQPMVLGASSVFTVNKSLYVMNFIGQEFYGKDGARYANLDAIKNGLTQVCLFVRDISKLQEFDEVLPLYIPKVGCGLGGLNWDDEVRPVVEQLATEHNIKIYVCEIPT